MTLSERTLRNAIYCATQELVARENGKAAANARVQPWNAELVRELELELAVSAAGQSDSADRACLEHEIWIGSDQAARILGWHVRTVRRRRNDLGGQKIAGALMFPESAVREYAEALTCSN